MFDCDPSMMLGVGFPLVASLGCPGSFCFGGARDQGCSPWQDGEDQDPQCSAQSGVGLSESHLMGFSLELEFKKSLASLQRQKFQAHSSSEGSRTMPGEGSLCCCCSSGGAVWSSCWGNERSENLLTGGTEGSKAGSEAGKLAQCDNSFQIINFLELRFSKIHSSGTELCNSRNRV